MTARAREVTDPVAGVLALAPALARRRIRLHGDPRLLLRFGAYFPA